MNRISFIIHEKPVFGMIALIAILFSFILISGSGIFTLVIFAFGFFINSFINRRLKSFFKKNRPRNTPKTMDYSFPSFHSQVSSYISAFFFMQNPLTIILTFPVYIVVIYHRISGKHHTLSDVIGGTIIGVLTGLVIGLL